MKEKMQNLCSEREREEETEGSDCEWEREAEGFSNINKKSWRERFYGVKIPGSSSRFWRASAEVKKEKRGK